MKSALTLVMAVAVVAVLSHSVSAQWMSIGGPRSTVVVPIPQGPARPLFEPAPIVVYPVSPVIVGPLPPVPPTPPVEPAPVIAFPTGQWERHGDGVTYPYVWVWISTHRPQLAAPEAEPSGPTSPSTR